MPLTKLEEMKLNKLKDNFPDLDTPDKALDEALYYEDMMRKVGAFDPTFSHWCSTRNHCFDLAVLLEKAAQ